MVPARWSAATAAPARRVPRRRRRSGCWCRSRPPDPAAPRRRSTAGRDPRCPAAAPPTACGCPAVVGGHGQPQVRLDRLLVRVHVPVLEPGDLLGGGRRVLQRDVVQQQRVVAERRVDEVLHVDAVRLHALAVVAGAELALGGCARGPVGVQGAHGLAVHAQVAVAAREVVARGLVEVGPLVAAVLAPELRVAVVEGVGHHVVVAHLVPGVVAAGQLRLLGLRRRLLVDPVAVRGQAEAVHAPAAEDAASVRRVDRDVGVVAGQRRGAPAGAALRAPRGRQARLIGRRCGACRGCGEPLRCAC